jgi:hypothetical protein
MPWFVAGVYIVPGALDHMAQWLLTPTLILRWGVSLDLGKRRKSTALLLDASPRTREDSQSAVQPCQIAGMWRASRLGFIPPQLPGLTDQPPQGADWIHEVKHDG